MAVAGVSVAMRRRTTRRLAQATFAAGVTGAIVAAVLLTRSLDHSGLPVRPQPSASASKAHLVFGMTPQQVQHLTGRPTATTGSCWLFRPTTTGRVGSISVQPSFSALPYDPRTTRDLKLCFLGGVYSDSYLREFSQSEGKWVWGAWPLTLSGSAPQ